jgi:4-amino-4-deoxy-L-arabinose transferase-like glycosyltransferase
MLGAVAKRMALATFFVLLALRVAAAARLDLFGDEAFYWQCSRRLDWGYADHPFMTALLVRLGSSLFGEGTLALRSAFLLLGAATTVVLFCLGRRLVGRDDALLGTTASLLLPALALSTFMALPDVPLVFFELAGLLAFERATAQDTPAGKRLPWWIATGGCAALGLATHARALLFPAAVCAWMLCCRRGRRQLATAGPWWGLAVAVVGIVPALLFNREHDFAQWRYQLSERHAEGATGFGQVIDHLAEQAAFVTPLLYVALIVCLLEACRRALRGDDRAGLVASFALVHLGVFWLASPWTDGAHTSLHWPLPGYLPLFVLLPDVLRRFSARNVWARRAAVASWGLAGLVVLVVVVDLGTRWLGVPYVHRPFAGWSEMTARAQQHLDAMAAEGQAELPVIVGDHYYVAAQLERTLTGGAATFTLDHPVLTNHGRALQYSIWEQAERGLSTLAGREVLLVVEWSAVRGRDRASWDEHLQQRFHELQPLSELSVDVPGGGRKFSFYRGSIAAEPGRSSR